MSGHIVVDVDMTVRKTQEIIRKLEKIAAEQFRIGHFTIQVEDDEHPHDDMFAIDRDWKH